MIYLAWVISLIAVGLLGYHYQLLVSRLASLTNWASNLGGKPTQSKPNAFFDGDDPALVAKHEFEERFEKMNPHIYDDPEQ